MAATSASMVFYIFSWLSLVVLTSLLKYLINKTRTNPRIQTPPSPPSLPIIGHLHLIGSSVIPKSFQALAKLYGPLIQLRLGASTFILVSNAQVAKQVLKTNEINFINRPHIGSTSEYNLYEGCDFVFAPYGPYWRFMKKLCMNELLSSSQLGRFMHVREQEIKKLLKSLMICSSEGRECDLGFELTTLTNNILCRTAMSTTCVDKDKNSNDDAVEIHGLVKEFLELGAKFSIGDVLGPLGKLDLFGYGKRLLKTLTRFDQIVERIMEEHEKKNDNEGETWDMMDVLLQVYRDPNAQVRLTRNHIKAFFRDIFLAGTDSSSVSVQWTMAEILNHPTVLKRLRAEIDAVVGSTRLVNESDVPNLPYLQAVVKEAMRLHPTAPLSLREAASDFSINGYNVKSQTRTIINIYAIMRDPEAWPNPEDFIPERFLDDTTNDGVYGDHYNLKERFIKMSVNDFRYIPFGFGKRGCPGASLALTVINLTVAALIQCFDWRIKGADRVNMEEGSSFSMGLAQPLVCYPVTCFNPFSL
ncbi:3,9-dihydroxypterocarpan 6A-monooxygenase-like [Arachis stenosperma]|uniref:3,9-dihydroxypterocarpan 6A-monooxygenase-like n=1 Tax=Arachis stenosperma TaxID=217475 RepID=UPI0025ACF78A|nr:3,9-dihydroxypterocarpan 6A-monooxygenase-like [Arachis stenosperma]